MVNEIHYGIISDVHQNPRIVPAAIEVLKRLGAEKLLINGDIGDQQRSLQDSQTYVAFILDSIGKSGLESYVQPGSHETLLAFGLVMDVFADKYSNLIDATKTPKAEQKGHSLIFLPGSDFLCGGEYQIGNHEQIPSGRYIQTQNGLIQFEEFDQYVSTIKLGIAQGVMQYANMNDLRKLVTNPDKSIVVCHVPRKFDNVEMAVDAAHYFKMREYRRDTKDSLWQVRSEEVMIPAEPIKKQWENNEKQGFNEHKIQEGINYGPGGSLAFSTYFSDQDIESYLTDLKSRERNSSNFCEILVERRENRGNKDLKSLYEELGINKAVSGHFHESGHRANDTYGNHVPEGKLVTDLFWNSGHLGAGQTGILTVGDGKVSYRNIRLEEHLR